MKTAKKTIALCASFAPSFINFRGKLIEQLLERDCDVLCVAPDFDIETKSVLEDQGARTASYPMKGQSLNPLSDISALRALVKVFKRENVHTAMGYTTKPAIYTSYACALAKTPRNIPMVTGLGYGFYPENPIKKLIIPPITRTLFRTSLKLSDGVIFHNKDNCDMFVKEKIISPQLPTWVVGGSGVDLSHFVRAPLPPIKPNTLKFLLIGRLVKYKGIMEFARAAEIVKKTYPGAEFNLVGGGDDNPLGLTHDDLDFVKKTVNYLGPQSDVRQAIKNCHIYVLPSYGEGMPRTVLEALATGRPIISTDVYGCRDTVIEGQNGYLVKAKDDKTLADAMLKFLKNPETIGPMSDASYKIAQEKFDVNIVNSMMCNALLDIKDEGNS